MSNSKTIVITGASSGIGLAVSRDVASGGAHMVMIARDPALADRLWSVSEALTAAGELSATEPIR